MRRLTERCSVCKVSAVPWLSLISSSSLAPDDPLHSASASAATPATGACPFPPCVSLFRRPSLFVPPLPLPALALPMPLNTPVSRTHTNKHSCLRLNLECVQPGEPSVAAAAAAAAAAADDDSDPDSEVEMSEEEEMAEDDEGREEVNEEEEEEMEEHPRTALDDLVQATSAPALLQPAVGVVSALAQQGLLLREAVMHQL